MDSEEFPCFAPSGDDVWYTAAIKKNEVPEIDRIKFWERAFGTPFPERRRPWALEASGRLLSHSETIRANAVERARLANLKFKPPNRSFRGIRFAEVSRIREDERLTPLYEPEPDDRAHSIITIMIESCDRIGDVVKIKQALAFDLDAMMPFFPEHDQIVEDLEARCGAPN